MTIQIFLVLEGAVCRHNKTVLLWVFFLGEANNFLNDPRSIYIYIYIPGRVIPKIQKMVFDTSIIRDVSRGKGSIPGKRVTPSSTPWYCCY